MDVHMHHWRSLMGSEQQCAFLAMMECRPWHCHEQHHCKQQPSLIQPGKEAAHVREGTGSEHVRDPGIGNRSNFTGSNMLPNPYFLLFIALFGSLSIASAQHVAPPSNLAEELCTCMGGINPDSNDRNFDLAVRQCLNAAVSQHSGEVIELLRRYPGQDRKFFMLGLVLGSALDRSCPQYPLVKDRLRLMLNSVNRNIPSS